MLALLGLRAPSLVLGGIAIRRHPWKWIILCVLAAALLVWLVSLLTTGHVFDWRVAIGSFGRLRWGWIAISVVPIFGTYLVRALRWAIFLRPLKPHASISRLLAATIVGFTAITLFGRPGEFVRPYLIARKEGVPVTSQVAAWALERLFDLLMALLVFAFALTRVQSSGMHVGAKLEWVLEAGGQVVAVTCVLVLGILLSLRHFADPVRRRLLAALHRLPEKRYRGIERLVDAIVEGVRSTRSDAAMVAVFLYSLAEWILICGCYWCLARAFHGVVNLGFLDVMILMGFVSFGSVIQIPGVGGGMQVVSVLVLTELFGVRVELASSFALFLWALTFVAIVPVGLFLGLKEGLDWHSLRRIGREVSSE
ncbi:MAG TPA: lysylphosphatidylglycerol synthase transmembrane domain-containing protein [Candidatus Acidoferrum sp.]|nr:lysylphosphatidylglycerol synthase transmembrane domain-containing protein [Candidatus Acidoferrum sp.]